MSKPNTLKEILEIAAPMFKDEAVVSVIVESAFGSVEVWRDGTMFLPDQH